MYIAVTRNNGGRALARFCRPMSLVDEIEESAQRVWDSWKPFTSYTGLVPHTDVYEEEGQLILKTELPGINKEDLDVILEGDRLTIKAEKHEEVIEDSVHHIRERHYGQYFRSLTIPFHAKGDKISATLDNGVLELRIPKAEETKAKRIEIRAELPQGGQKKQKRTYKVE